MRALLLSLHAVLTMAALGNAAGEPTTVPAAATAVFSPTTRELRLALPATDEVQLPGDRLSVRLLDEKDGIRGTVTVAPDGSASIALWRVALPVQAGVTREQLAWWRVEYGLVHAWDPVSGKPPTRLMLGAILSAPQIRLISPPDIMPGIEAVMSLRVEDRRLGGPLSGMLILDFTPKTGSPIEVKATLDSEGQAVMRFTPDVTSRGPAVLKFTTITPVGDETFSGTVSLTPKIRLYLSTDKPSYQPGQTIHVRLLALDERTLRPAADAPVEMTITDGDYNRVFRKKLKTDAFGSAAARFTLADEVNLGRYKLNALLYPREADAATPQRWSYGNRSYWLADDATDDRPSEIEEERELQVARYLLPKFKVKLEFSPSPGGEKSDHFAWGGTIHGRVTAKFLHGDPVPGASVTVTLRDGYDEKRPPSAKFELRTDATGSAVFQWRAPEADRERDWDDKSIQAEAVVNEAAGASELVNAELTLSNGGFSVFFVPANLYLVKGLPNRGYLTTRSWEGRAVKARITSACLPGAVSTGELGVVETSWNCPPGAKEEVSARDDQGHRSRWFEQSSGDPRESGLQMILPRVIYRPDETVEMKIFTTDPMRSVHLDLFHAGQRMQSLTLSPGPSPLTARVKLDGSAAGPLELIARSYTDDGQLEDRRILYADPGGMLHVTPELDMSRYIPGGEARLRYTVRDASGTSKPALLGLTLVDEAVFARGLEEQPRADAYFQLANFSRSYLFPRDPDGDASLLEGTGGAAASERRAAWRAASAIHNWRDLYRDELLKEDPLQTRNDEAGAAYVKLARVRLAALLEKLNGWYKAGNPTTGLISLDLKQAMAAGVVTAADRLDPWNRPFVLDGIVYQPATYLPVPIQFQGAEGPGRVDAIPVIASRNDSTDAPVNRSTVMIKRERLSWRKDGKTPILNITAEDSDLHKSIAFHVNVRDGDGIAHELAASEYGIYGNGFHPGDAQFEVRADGHHPFSFIVPKLKGPETVTIKVMLEPRRGSLHLAIPVETENAIEAAVSLSGGGLTGKVTDDKGHPLPGVIIKAKGPLGTKAAETDSLGRYAIYRLATGVYEVSASMDQFGTVVQSGVAIVFEQTTTQNFKMASGSGGTIITVKGTGMVEKTLSPPDHEHGQSPPGKRLKVRNYFPETLFVNPMLLTDSTGHAEVTIPLADSITDWRLTTVGNTLDGRIGVNVSPLKVFQPFFVDIELPSQLTEGDLLEAPVEVRNFGDKPVEVEISLSEQTGFKLEEENSVKHLTIAAGASAGSTFKLRALVAGSGAVTVTARASSGGAEQDGDAVRRTVEILPAGEVRESLLSGQLRDHAELDLAAPAGARPGLSTVDFRLYPGGFSQALHGAEALVQRPYGCLEQTTSVTWLNALLWKHLHARGAVTPEREEELQGLLSAGVQRLHKFEVEKGGYSLWGDKPSSPILTAYMLLAMHDIGAAYETDPDLSGGAHAWLIEKQRPDGSWSGDEWRWWKPTAAQERVASIRATALAAWALGASGETGETLPKAWKFLSTLDSGSLDNYSLALLVNAAQQIAPSDPATARLLTRLRERAHRAQGAANWPLADGTPFFSWGRSAVVETTALAAQALLRDEKDPSLADESLKWLFQQGDAFGTWWATQPTAQTLRAVLMAAGRGTSEDASGTVQARLGAEAIALTMDDTSRDLLQQRRFQTSLPDSGAKLGLSHVGPGALQYQVVIRSIHPWDSSYESSGESPFHLRVEYDRTKARRNDLLTATVTASNRKSERADMVMIELGLPPGAEPLDEDLRQLAGMDDEGERSNERASTPDRPGEVTKYEKQPGRIILYMDGLAPRQTFTFKLRLRVRFAIEAKTLPSRIYAYYNPERFTLAPPEEITVRYGADR